MLHVGRIALLVLAGFALAPAAHAQPFPDTTSAWRYFPLEIGNAWEYSKWHTSSFTGDSLTSYRRWSVVDTADAGGRRYHVVREEQYGADGAPWPDSTRSILVRFDTLSARLLVRGEGGEERGWPFAFPCSFEGGFGDIIECDGGVSAILTGGTHLQVAIGDTSFYSTVKIYRVQGGYQADEYSFAADIGLVRRAFGESLQAYDLHQSEYARVGGVAYGRPIPVAAEPPAPPPPAVRLAPPAPNPVRGATALTFALPAPSRVRLSVFDLLGREVARLADVPRPAGEHRVRFETAALPAGIYVIRLEAAGEVQARTMAVVR